eukprot:TRINITY_DN56826_c0_g1_i1.p1 TRINITY_DN56826_c0_g1~~TRINITY_DN56826_c0_g1_i1.p1  ORF type:complete len:102 (+),score=12.58 TRINITY_DN56826_c0_g1_i1:154-459(+)
MKAPDQLKHKMDMFAEHWHLFGVCVHLLAQGEPGPQGDAFPLTNTVFVDKMKDNGMFIGLLAKVVFETSFELYRRQPRGAQPHHVAGYDASSWSSVAREVL